MSEGLFSYIHMCVIAHTEMHSYLHSKFMEMSLDSEELENTSGKH